MHNANDHQVGGSHYDTGTIQHWDYVQIGLGGAYLMGNLTKYVVRHRKKNGFQDLEKAYHYLQKITELHSAGKLRAAWNNNLKIPRCPDTVIVFCENSGLNEYERQICTLAAVWRGTADLGRINALIAKLMEQARRRQDIAEDQDSHPGAGYVDQSRDVTEQSEQPSKRIDGQSMRKLALEISKKHAARSGKSYACVKDFVPHEWVVQALIDAMELKLNGS